MKAPKKELVFIDGFTESAWKSLVVKSLRIGWVEGLIAAAERLPKSTMTGLLTSGLFEDVFPAGWGELNDAYTEILHHDYMNLCSRETHHGRAYTNQFCDMADEACGVGVTWGEKIVVGVKENTDLRWINPRVYNCLYTWWKIDPQDKGVLRQPLIHKFEGIPANVLDSHTYEGKKAGRKICLLSGHYENHRAIGERVMREGWGGLRKEFIKDRVYIPDAGSNLF